MRRPHRTFRTKTWVIVALCLTIRLSAQQPAAPPAVAPHAVQLEPLIIDDGKHQGEVVLTLDLDSNGSIANAVASSGGDLVPFATASAKLFRHPSLPGASGLTQRVVFVRGPDVKSVAPVYPPIARAAHVSGTVHMVATVAPDGHVTDVTVLDGPPMLRGSASDALLKWIFPPVQAIGSPVQSHAVVTVNFELR